MNASLMNIALAAVLTTAFQQKANIETKINGGTVLYVHGLFVKFNGEDGRYARAHALTSGKWLLQNPAGGQSEVSSEEQAIDLFCAIVATA